MKPAYPASPSRNPILCMYITHTGTGKIWIVPWAALYPAKRVLEYMREIQDDVELHQTAHDFATIGAFTIKCAELNDILEHEYTPEEKEWQLPDMERKTIMRLTGVKPEPSTEPKAEPSTKPQRRTPAPDGMIYLQQICAEASVEPRIARMKLRAAKEPNTHGNWSFKPEDADRIKKIIK